MKRNLCMSVIVFAGYDRVCVLDEDETARASIDAFAEFGIEADGSLQQE